MTALAQTSRSQRGRGLTFTKVISRIHAHGTGSRDTQHSLSPQMNGTLNSDAAVRVLAPGPIPYGDIDL